MLNKGGELAKIIESCRKRVVYVNNPSLSIKDDSLSYKKKRRTKSREKILSHLKKNCQGDSYKPEKLARLSKEIVNFMDSKIKLKEELEKLVPEGSRLTEAQDFESEGDKSESENIFTKNDKTELSLGKKQINKNQTKENDSDVEARITKLEIEIKKLEKGIKKNEEIIRQKILKHIFNNYDRIVSVAGGEILIDKLSGDNND